MADPDRLERDPVRRLGVRHVGGRLTGVMAEEEVVPDQSLMDALEVLGPDAGDWLWRFRPLLPPP